MWEDSSIQSALPSKEAYISLREDRSGQAALHIKVVDGCVIATKIASVSVEDILKGGEI